jgi:hypothetical protein
MFKKCDPNIIKHYYVNKCLKKLDLKESLLK